MPVCNLLGLRSWRLRALFLCLSVVNLEAFQIGGVSLQGFRWQSSSAGAKSQKCTGAERFAGIGAAVSTDPLSVWPRKSRGAEGLKLKRSCGLERPGLVLKAGLKSDWVRDDDAGSDKDEDDSLFYGELGGGEAAPAAPVPKQAKRAAAGAVRVAVGGTRAGDRHSGNQVLFRKRTGARMGGAPAASKDVKTGGKTVAQKRVNKDAARSDGSTVKPKQGNSMNKYQKLDFSDPRDIAYNVLLNRETGKGADFIENLIDTATTRSQIAGPERAMMKEIVVGCVRWKELLDHLVKLKQKGSKRQQPGVRVLLRIGLYQLFIMDKVPAHAAVDSTVELAKRTGLKQQSGFINAVLRGYAREEEETRALIEDLQDSQPHIGWSHPEWLYKIWAKRFGAEATKALMKWNNTPAPNFARVNKLRCSVYDALKTWEEEEVLTEEVKRDWIDEKQLYSIRVPKALSELQSFQSGFFYMQDPSTLLSVQTLDPKPGLSLECQYGIFQSASGTGEPTA